VRRGEQQMSFETKILKKNSAKPWTLTKSISKTLVKSWSVSIFWNICPNVDPKKTHRLRRSTSKLPPRVYKRQGVEPKKKSDAGRARF
jgi:hypothetical protein